MEDNHEAMEIADWGDRTVPFQVAGEEPITWTTDIWRAERMRDFADGHLGLFGYLVTIWNTLWMTRDEDLAWLARSEWNWFILEWVDAYADRICPARMCEKFSRDSGIPLASEH
jgi:hypothetical protein